jgi:hypothetical protein
LPVVANQPSRSPAPDQHTADWLADQLQVMSAGTAIIDRATLGHAAWMLRHYATGEKAPSLS